MKKPIEVKVTREGYQKFLDEQKTLTEKRPGVLMRMVAAREQGDLSENAGYHAAKEELGRIDRRLRELKLMIRFAEVIEAGSSGLVSIGSKVVVDDGSVKKEFFIVGVSEANPAEGKLSEKSPIGSALIGKGAGDEVEVDIPDGKAVFKILKVN